MRILGKPPSGELTVRENTELALVCQVRGVSNIYKNQLEKLEAAKAA